MRRRRPLDVWPAFADLMTVLAIVGLFTTLALARHGKTNEELIAHLEQSERQRKELQDQLDLQKREQEARERRLGEDLQDLQRQVREAARNEKMFQAIQEAQRFIDEISRGSGLAFAPDQSLQFGDDLVSFKVNSVEPIWQKGSWERLRKFCEAISGRLASLGPTSSEMPRLFIVQIEGHTDSSQCPGDPDCNWWISSGRAAAFLTFMRQPRYCPGGGELVLRPVGFADSRPAMPNAQPSRRIAVRLVPNYEQIIAHLD